MARRVAKAVHAPCREFARPIPVRLVKAITFDIGGTLIEPWPSVGHLYAQEASAHGAPGLDPEVINRRFAQAWSALKLFRYTRPEWAALVATVFSELLARPPSRTFFSALYRRFAEADAWRVFPEVLPVLDRLSARGLRLGIISNWDRRLRPLLRELKLHDRFQTIVVSCDLGVFKPSPAIFRHAARKLGQPPKAVLHVGDNLKLDAQGARSAGLRGVWLCRDGSTGPPAGAIRSLAGLERHLI